MDIKKVNVGDVVISEYLGASIRKWAETFRNSGKKLPRVYMYCDTLPIRDRDGVKVIVEGKYKLGCYVDGHSQTLQTFIARTGYKLPTSGSKERCIALLEEFKQALNQTGKYAPKASKPAK